MGSTCQLHRTKQGLPPALHNSVTIPFFNPLRPASTSLVKGRKPEMRGAGVEWVATVFVRFLQEVLGNGMSSGT